MFKYIIFVMTVLSGLLIHVSGLEVIVKMLVIAVDLYVCMYLLTSTLESMHAKIQVQRFKVPHSTHS